MGIGSDFLAFGFGVPLVAPFGFGCDLEAIVEEDADFVRPEVVDLELGFGLTGEGGVGVGASERSESPSMVRSTKTDLSGGPAMLLHQERCENR